MRKRGYVLLAPLFLTLVGSPLYAQAGLSAGTRFGVGIANFGGDVENTDSKTGLAAGAFLGIDLHPNFRLEFDGQYVQKGASFSDQGLELDFKLDYLELKVPATLTLPIPASQFTPRLYAGPAIALEMSCGLSASDGTTDVDIDCDQLSEASGGLIEDLETKSLDIGVFFGGGLDIAVFTGAITLDVLYNLGLTDINDSTGELGAGEIKNKNLQIMAGYRIPLGR